MSYNPQADPGKAIDSISVGPLSKGKYRAFAWKKHVEGQPCGSPLGIIDGDSLGEAVYEMLRAIRGERGLD